MSSSSESHGTHDLNGPAMTPIDKLGMGELLARVKAATGPDRDLDHALWLHFDETAQEKYDAGRIPLPWTWCLTSSIDAALALTERMLPEMNCCGIERDPSGWCAFVSRNHIKIGHWYKEAYAPTAPLALLLALLTALDTNKGDGE